MYYDIPVAKLTQSSDDGCPFMFQIYHTTMDALSCLWSTSNQWTDKCHQKLNFSLKVNMVPCF